MREITVKLKELSTLTNSNYLDFSHNRLLSAVNLKSVEENPALLLRVNVTSCSIRSEI